MFEDEHPAADQNGAEDELQNALWKSFQDKIRRRAYELYIQRGGVDGRALDDWLQSEAELFGPAAARAAQRPTGRSRSSRRK
jgi:Protein of unknown function (DUF2934)